MNPTQSLHTAVSLGYPVDETARFLSADPSVLKRPISIGRKSLGRIRELGTLRNAPLAAVWGLYRRQIRT